jgi:hypothetical protein
MEKGWKKDGKRMEKGWKKDGKRMEKVLDIYKGVC